MKAPLIFAALLTVSAPSFGAVAENRFAATIVPAEKFDVGTLLVERHGDHGSPMIFIPGLSSGAWAWQDAVRQFRTEHIVYVVTLPGFDGRKPIAGNAFDAAQKSLLELIASHKIAKPVLVGHSLGGTLSIALAEGHSDVIGGVIALEGLPVFPGTEGMLAEQRPQMAAGMKARMGAPTSEAFASQQQQYMRGIGVIDMGKADDLAKLSANSDPAAVIEYMAEVVALDLRSALPKITVPVLVISPYFQADGEQMKIPEDGKVAYYKSLMAGTPKLEVVSVSPARHFAMFDQPQKVADAIRAFMNKR
ncbi:MAG: alpha/beta hydrolase [Pseudomonadota bacterium]